MTIKSELICAINKKKDCLRCGMETFTLEVLKNCRAKGKQGNKSGITGRFGNLCKNNSKETNTTNISTEADQLGRSR